MSGRPVAPSDRLGHVCWIGGGSGSGKSTVARRLADRHELTLYSTDESMADHAQRAPVCSAPLLTTFLAMDMDQRWVTRSATEMLATFHWFQGEGFDLIVDDLRSLAPEPVLAEGFRLLPDLVAPLLGDRGRAVWLLPTPAFRRAAFETRGLLGTFPARTSNPARALENLLERDRLFTERLASDVARLHLDGVVVDGSVSEDALVEQVAGLLLL